MSDQYHLRPAAADYIQSRGFPITKNTLQKMATTGGGPTYRRFGNRVVYRQADLDAWIERKLSAPIASTSELLANREVGQ